MRRTSFNAIESASETRGLELPEPRTQFGHLLRDLASAAMSITHHDINEDEPEYRHEVEAMERAFRKVLRKHRGRRP